MNACVCLFYLHHRDQHQRRHGDAADERDDGDGRARHGGGAREGGAVLELELDGHPHELRACACARVCARARECVCASVYNCKHARAHAACVHTCFHMLQVVYTSRVPNETKNAARGTRHAARARARACTECTCSDTMVVGADLLTSCGGSFKPRTYGSWDRGRGKISLAAAGLLVLLLLLLLLLVVVLLLLVLSAWRALESQTSRWFCHRS